MSATTTHLGSSATVTETSAVVGGGVSIPVAAATGLGGGLPPTAGGGYGFGPPSPLSPPPVISGTGGFGSSPPPIAIGIQPGYPISSLTGGGSNSRLDLLAGGTTGTITGIGTEIVDFGTIEVDSGAHWVLSGDNTIASSLKFEDDGVMTNAGVLDVHGILLVDPGTMINNGQVAGAITLGAGSYLDNAGTVAASTAVIGTGGQVTVSNTGTIIGLGTAAGAAAIYLKAGGTITNGATGTIAGLAAIEVSNSAGTVVNSGFVSGGDAVGGAGVDLAAGGAFTNAASGLVNGYRAVDVGVLLTTSGPFQQFAATGAGAVSNSGTIMGSQVGAAVGNGNVYNQSGGVIDGGSLDGVLLGSAETVTNSGFISGGYFGAYLPAGGSVSNAGVISGGDAAVGAGLLLLTTLSGTGSVTNTGTIDGSEAGILLTTGYVLNSSSGIIAGGQLGVAFADNGSAGGAGTVINAGTIIAGDFGVVLTNGGTIVNGDTGDSSALIAGSDGLAGSSGSAGFGGDGSAGGDAVIGGLDVTGVSNGGTIAGGAGGSGGDGAEAGGNGGGGGAGVAVLSGGSLIVMNSGLIVGGAGGAGGSSVGGNGGNGGQGGTGIGALVTATVANTGSIVGGAGDTGGSGGISAGTGGIAGFGIALEAGGTVVNGNAGDETALIAGYFGVFDLPGTAGITVTNFGTIASTYGTIGTAVTFANTADRLILEGGSMVVGAAVGSGSALELDGAGGSGTLTGLGSQFTGFGSVTVDSGASWTLSGSNAIASGTTLTAQGVLTLSGALDVSGLATGNIIIGNDATENVLAGGSVSGITFGGSSGTLDLTTPQELQGVVSNWQAGDVIDFVSTSVTGATISGATLDITVSGGQQFTYALADREADSYAELQPDGAGGTDLLLTLDNSIPSQMLSSGYSGNENAAIPLGSLSVSVSPVAGDPLSTVLSVSEGTLTVGTSGGAAIGGNGTNVVTLSGTAAEIDTALAHASYIGEANFYGTDTLSMTTTDTIDDKSTALQTATVTVADIATIGETLPRGLTGIWGTPISLAGISVRDNPNSGDALTTVMKVKNGTITIGSASGAAVNGNNTGTVTLTGTAAEIDAALAAADYRANASSTGSDTLSITTTDPDGRTSGKMTVAITSDLPGAPDPGLGLGAGPAGALNETNVTDPTFTGVAAPFSLVVLYDGSRLEGVGFSDWQGVWAIEASAPLPLGTQQLTATAYDLNGSVSARTTIDVIKGHTFTSAAGGAQNVNFQAGNGNNTLQWGTGAGVAIAGNGNNKVAASNGADIVRLGNGNNAVSLGNGNDSVAAGSGANTVTLGNGDDTVELGAGVLIFGFDDDLGHSVGGLNTVTIGNGNDTISLGGNRNSLVVGDGDDLISLGGGDDRITLGTGAYTITGTPFGDNGGDDVFLTAAPATLTMAFNSGDEFIFNNVGFDLGVDDGKGTGSPQRIAASLLSANTNGTFANAGNRFAYNQATGNLYYDAQGNKPGSAAQLIAHLTNDPHLNATELYFVS